MKHTKYITKILLESLSIVGLGHRGDRAQRSVQFRHRDAGFTIVELVATLLMMFAVVQIFVAITNDVNSSALVRDNLIAANLVQEGIEVARNIRDKDWFSGGGFGASLPDGIWRVQWDSVSLLALDSNPFLKKDAFGFFNYNSGADTVFRRTVTISRVSSEEINVSSSVIWDFRGDSKSISAEVHLFNWFRP